MTAKEIFILRTHTTEEEAESYIGMAELKAREYLRYGDEESLTAFASTIADVAVLYYQRDAQVSALTNTAATGVKSESFSEGAVSASKSYLTAGDLFEMYDNRTDKVLDGIRRYRRARVVNLGATDGTNTG